MSRPATTCLIAALILGVFINHAIARGRSFPIEITGVITNLDRAKHTFAIRADEPARVLSIAVGRYCRFKTNGVTAGEQILKRGARVKVSYFATIFTGNVAVEIESNPAPEVKTGTIVKIEPLERKLQIRLRNGSCDLVVHWAINAQFLKAGKPVSVANLKEHTVVRLSYYSPAFASKYATKIELE